MPLVQCPDCGKDISDSAPACPNCGRPMIAAVGTEAAQGVRVENVVTVEKTGWDIKNAKAWAFIFGIGGFLLYNATKVFILSFIGGCCVAIGIVLFLWASLEGWARHG